MTKTLASAAVTALLLSVSACSGGDAGPSGDASSSPSAASPAGTPAETGSSAAGSGSLTPQESKAAASIAKSIMNSQQTAGSASQFFSMDQQAADCIGTGLVDKIGTDKLQAYKLLDKDLTSRSSVTDTKMAAGDARAATGVLFGCTDVQGMMKKAITKSGNVTAEMRTCVDEALTEPTLRTMFTQIFRGKPEAAQAALVAPMMKCATAATSGAN